jgi:hypothetical protein
MAPSRIINKVDLLKRYPGHALTGDEAFGEEAADLLQALQRPRPADLGCALAPWMTGVPAETI